MTPNSHRPSVRRHPFLFSLLLLALIAASVVGYTVRARLGARPNGAVSTLAKRPGLGTVGSALIATDATANDGRDFAGFYEEMSATDLGEDLYVSVKFQIFNYCGANVNGATLRLLDRLTHESRWSLAGVAIEDRRSIVLTQDFTVPRQDYENWQKGGTPNLTIEYQSDQGGTTQHTIELSRMLIGEVQ